jgi:hypothetical protein
MRQKGIGVSRTTKTASGERHERGKRHPMTLKGVLRHALTYTTWQVIAYEEERGI